MADDVGLLQTMCKLDAMDVLMMRIVRRFCPPFKLVTGNRMEWGSLASVAVATGVMRITRRTRGTSGLWDSVNRQEIFVIINTYT